MTSVRKAISVHNREFAVSLPAENLSHIQKGTLNTKYKGFRFCKNPFDIVLYLRLIEKLKPRTIIEIGTLDGGSAVWFRDQCSALELGTIIHSFDINPPENFAEAGIVLGQADAFAPDLNLPTETLKSLPRPWLVIEDSAHKYQSTINVLRYFDGLVMPGDYVVVEDGVVADLPGAQYEKYDDGPNRAVQAFLQENPGRYTIDEDLCDFFGPNVTYCPNGWLYVTG